MTEELLSSAPAGQARIAAMAPPHSQAEASEVPLTREHVRGRIALGLLAVISIQIAMAWVTAISSAMPPTALRDLLAITLAPVVAVFGTVTGFYYGTISGERSARDDDA